MPQPEHRSLNAPSVRLKVGFILARCFTLTAFAMFADTLRLASDEADKSGRILADWAVISNSRHLITSSCGIQLSPTSSLVDPRNFDYIVVVGGRLTDGPAVDNETLQYLRNASAAGTSLIGLCTGTFVLAEAGLMTSHATCVSWLHYQDYRQRFPDLAVQADRIFNLDTDRGSCAGGSSSADLAAELVKRHIGREALRNALEVMQIDKPRPADAVQSRRPLSISAHNPTVRAALLIMEQNVENTLTVSELADCLRISRRQLERLFFNEVHCSPSRAYRRVRLERAKKILRERDAPLIDVAIEVGFENASHFSRLFRQAYGQTPTTWRRKESIAETL